MAELCDKSRGDYSDVPPEMYDSFICVFNEVRDTLYYCTPAITSHAKWHYLKQCELFLRKCLPLYKWNN